MEVSIGVNIATNSHLAALPRRAPLHVFIK
jgi:hypothetical protein